MFAFIFEIGIFISLVAIILIALRAVPRVSNEVFTESRSRVRVHEFMIMLERVDDVLKMVLEKILRKVKIILLKLDNIVTKKISKFKNDRIKEKAVFVIPNGEAEEGNVISEQKEEPTPAFVTEVKIEEEVPVPLKKRKARKKVSL